jgi:hypothetical protein
MNSNVTIPESSVLVEEFGEITDVTSDSHKKSTARFMCGLFEKNNLFL